MITFAVSIGASCASPDQSKCSSIGNAECDGSSQCACSNGYYGASGATTCTQGNVI